MTQDSSAPDEAKEAVDGSDRLADINRRNMGALVARRGDVGRQRRTDPILGSDPVAYLMYDAARHFAVQFMARDRGLASSDRGPLRLGAATIASTGYDAYFGRYTVGVDGTLSQELVGALSPQDVGKVVTRRCHIGGGRTRHRS